MWWEGGGCLVVSRAAALLDLSRGNILSLSTAEHWIRRVHHCRPTQLTGGLGANGGTDHAGWGLVVGQIMLDGGWWWDRSCWMGANCGTDQAGWELLCGIDHAG